MEQALTVIRDLIATPNGQVRLWAAVMTLGALFGDSLGVAIPFEMRATSFATGIVFMIVSIWMADRRAGFEAAKDKRVCERSLFALSTGTEAFVRLIDRPLEQHELAEVPSEESTDVNELRRKLRILRGREAAREGKMLYWTNGQFTPRNI